MSDLPAALFANVVWEALRTRHRNLAVCVGDACRYPADVVRFAAVGAPTAEAMRQFHSLLAPGEATWMIGERFPEIPELVCEGTLEALQMVLPDGVRVPEMTASIEALTEANAHEMVALTTLAFPGFFRTRTYEMGSYYGVRSESGELIAMGGERLKLEGFSEISAVCTHPSFRGKGLATNIMWELVRQHRREGVVSWLHVGCANQRAAKLYLAMGFQTIRQVTLQRFARKQE
jgi:ribosomal protein S18 acetylase RimI-like enzyme